MKIYFIEAISKKMGPLRWHSGKNSTCKAGDAGVSRSIPGSGRSCGGGNDNPLQYSCLENSTDKGAWRATVCGVTKSQTRLSTQAWTHDLREYWTDFVLHILWKMKNIKFKQFNFFLNFIFRKTNYENFCLKTNESKALLESSVNATQVAFICAVLWHKIAFHFSHQSIG